MEQIRTASHIGLWIAVISLIIFLAWSAVNKKTTEDIYSGKAFHQEETNNFYGIVPLSWKGCAYTSTAAKGGPKVTEK